MSMRARIAIAVTSGLLMILAASEAASQENVVTRQAIIRGLVIVNDEVPGAHESPPSAAPVASSPAPSIEFYSIEFGINSSELAPEARAQLEELAAALSSEELRAYRFEIIGHTDARGSREHNLALSQRRAYAVRDFLLQVAGVNPRRLEATGRGMDALVRPDDPYAAENRRVEIRNLGEQR
jgi:OmpA-OmpF porin, OOP family